MGQAEQINCNAMGRHTRVTDPIYMRFAANKLDEQDYIPGREREVDVGWMTMAQ